MLKRFPLLVLATLIVLSAGSQEVSKNIQRADKAFSENNFPKARANYHEAVRTENLTAYLARQLGHCYRFEEDLVQAEAWYETAIKQADCIPWDHFLLGSVQRALGKDEQASSSIGKFFELQKTPDMSGTPNFTGSFLAQFRKSMLVLKAIPVNINSPEADFSPSFFSDALVWSTSRFDRELQRIKKIDPKQHLNLYSAKLSPSFELGVPTVFAENLLSQFYTGPIAFSPTFDTAYFVRKKYTNVRIGDEKKLADNNLKIHRAIYSLGNWVDQGPLSFCSDNFSVGDPMVSPDGKRLYFTSDMPGGIGGTDLYYREIKPNGAFGDAINLGAKVNTTGNEMHPFVANDGTLFFSSDKHPGFGNLDVFAAFPTGSGYDLVTNLGYPINGIYDDFGLILHPNGRIAFFSSNRPEGKGDDDIYRVEIERIVVTHTIAGVVSNENGEPLPGATIAITDGINTLASLKADASGRFTYSLDNDKELTIRAECNGFFPSTERVSSSGLGLKSAQIPVNIKMARDVGYTLTGTILAADGNGPIDNAQVVASPPDSTKAISGVTNPMGQFRFKLEAETDYHIRITKGGYVGKKYTLTTKGRERGEINLSTLFDTKLVADVKPGFNGIVTDLKTSQPIGSAIITIKSIAFPQGIRIASNENGSFMQSNLTEGDYSIAIEKDGYKPLKLSVSLGKQPINLNTLNLLALEPIPTAITAIGIITSKDDNNPVIEATVTLVDRATNEKQQKHTDEFGSFDFRVEPDRIYFLKFEKDKFFTKTLMINTQGVQPGMFNLNASNDLKMEAIVMNKAIEIPNIYYDLGKWNIKPDAAKELDKLVTLLNENPTIEIELSSHTDSRGNAAQNLSLSQKRADAAVEYILSKGISPTRLTSKGYGDSMIKNHCAKGVKCSEAEHAVNRRTEIRVTKF